MSAKRDDWSRLQEIPDGIIATQSQMQELSFSEQRFLHPSNAFCIRATLKTISLPKEY